MLFAFILRAFVLEQVKGRIPELRTFRSFTKRVKILKIYIKLENLKWVFRFIILLTHFVQTKVIKAEAVVNHKFFKTSHVLNSFRKYRFSKLLNANLYSVKWVLNSLLVKTPF